MATLDPNNPHALKFARRLCNPLLQRLFLLIKLPAAYFMGVRVKSIVPGKSAEVTVPFGWRSQNPFRSIYFAAQASAAEMSTGVLALMMLQGRPEISVLVASIQGDFIKKATSKTTFTCMDGEKIIAAIEKAIETKTGQTVTCESIGVQKTGEIVSKFYITWTFKVR